MIGTYTFKYHGILKNFDLDKISKDTFPKLIEANIFDVAELSSEYKAEDDYFDLVLDDSYWGSCFYYQYNYNSYSLKDRVVEDMFDYCEFKSESLDELEEKILDLELNLNMQVSHYSKIKYLKTEIFLMHKSMKDSQYYLLYANGRETRGYTSWFNFFSSEQIDCDVFTFVFKYLKGDRDFVPTFIKEIWIDYYFVKNLTKYCQDKIHQIERISGIKEVDVSIENEITNLKLYNVSNTEKKETITEYKDIRTDIFRDENSRMLFDFIIEKWIGKKNTSFYSMLYKYLQRAGKIIILDKDSSPYRNFIIENYNLKGFAKIQQQTTDKENNKWNVVFKTFKDVENKFTL